MHLLGTYTAPEGEGEGIHRMSSGGVELLAPLPSPSFVAAHPTLPVLYAVAEHRGELVVLDATTGSVLQDGLPAGEAACHVRVADDGLSAVVACWGDGSVVRYGLGPDGLVIDRQVVPTATGADPDAPSRAHASLAFGDLVVTTDLGLDLVRVWRDGDGGLTEVQRLTLPTGSGPRHLVARGDLLWVDTEYSNEIVTIARDADGVLSILGTASARVGGSVDGDTSAEIALDPTGAWLTVGVRGSDVIAVSRILLDGTTEPVSESPAGGEVPRHHVHDGDSVLVALQGSSLVTRLPFDPATGRLGDAVVEARVGSPTFLLPVVE